jgi:hypothetical protein
MARIVTQNVLIGNINAEHFLNMLIKVTKIKVEHKNLEISINNDGLCKVYEAAYKNSLRRREL